MRKVCRLAVLLAIVLFSLFLLVRLARELVPDDFTPNRFQLINKPPAAISPEYNTSKKIRRDPKITLTAVWGNRGSSITPDAIGGGCPSYSHASNIQELCLTPDEYYRLHVNFLCKRWLCTNEEKSIAFEHMKKMGKQDPNFTFFRILRGGVFAGFMDPSTTIWGWCDVDLVWGNLSRTFPWDVADNFDFFTVTGQPDFYHQRLLYLRGHMAFFQHSPEVLEKLHSYPKFASLTSYLTLPPTLPDAEESEFSHYVFSQEQSLTFLTFEGTVNSYDTILLSPRGSFYSYKRKENTTPEERQRLAALARPSSKEQVLPTFSEEGDEETAIVIQGAEGYLGGLWIDRRYVQYVETGWTDPPRREQKAYFMRRESFGPITQRLEPRARYLDRDGDLWVDECFYKHWQEEKRKAWFSRLPKSLGPGEILVQYGDEQIDVWNEFGDVLSSTAD